MWDRKILKSNAKLAIRGNRFWIGFAVVLVVAACQVVQSFLTKDVNDQMTSALLFGKAYPDPAELIWRNLLAGLLFLLVEIPLSIGSARFFVRNRFGNTRFGTVFTGFQSGYRNTVGASFVTDLLIFLWALLLFIPGVVKGLQYSMVPYLLSDNPGLNGARARKISSLMTDGEKGAIFVLQLSFLGLLLCLPVGTAIFLAFLPTPDGVISFVVMAEILLVLPYYCAAFAELYVFLRDRIIQTGLVQPAELNLTA